MFVSQTLFLRVITALHVLLGVSFQFFLPQIAPLFWKHPHVASSQEALVIGVFGVHLVSMVPLLLNLRSQTLYRAANLALAVIYPIYILFTDVLATMQPHSFIFFTLLALSYAFSSSSSKTTSSAGAKSVPLAAWQRYIQTGWTLIITFNALHSIFAPLAFESTLLSPPAASAYSIATFRCYGVFFLQVAALWQSATSKSAMRNCCLVLALGWAVQIYGLHFAVASTLTKSYPVLVLATAYAFHV